MFGLTMTNSANASLLNNFEIVATSIIALVCFKEIISPKLWTAILFITVSTIILSFEDMSAFAFSKVHSLSSVPVYVGVLKTTVPENYLARVLQKLLS